MKSMNAERVDFWGLRDKRKRSRRAADSLILPGAFNKIWVKSQERSPKFVFGPFCASTLFATRSSLDKDPEFP
jgi:hypothetical protein